MLFVWPFHRFTYGSWTMRCRIPMSARGTSWPCTTAAALWRTWKLSSAAPWPTMWCCALGWEWSACGPTRAAGIAASRCFSRPSKNVRVSALPCPSLGGFHVHPPKHTHPRSWWCLLYGFSLLWGSNHWHLTCLHLVPQFGWLIWASAMVAGLLTVPPLPGESMNVVCWHCFLFLLHQHPGVVGVT